MFSEISKTISLHAVPKPVVGVGIVSFAANETSVETIPTPTTGFGATHHVPAGGARCALSFETFATIIFREVLSHTHIPRKK